MLVSEAASTVWLCVHLNGTDPVMGDLEGLQVWTGEVGGGEETGRDPVGSERQRWPVEHLLLPSCAQIQHLQEENVGQ